MQHSNLPPVIHVLPRRNEEAMFTFSQINKMAYYEPADLDKLLGNDGRNAVRNEFLEVIF